MSSIILPTFNRLEYLRLALESVGDCLGQLSELSRLCVLVGYLRHFKPGGSILDMGCGEGVLLDRLGSSDFSHYEGVDLSRVAIDRANQHRRPNAAPSAADAQVYVPGDTFDTIVFDDVLYHFDDPIRMVGRYAQALNERGVLMLSINTAFRGGVAILDDLERRHTMLDDTRVTRDDHRWSWVCTVLSSTRDGAQRDDRP